MTQEEKKISESNSNSVILNEESFPYSYSLKPIQPYYVEPSKNCGGYISQISRDKARKKNRKNRLKY